MKKTYKLNFCEIVNHSHDVIIETDIDYDQLDILLDSIERDTLNSLDDYIHCLKESGIDIKEVIDAKDGVTTSIECEDID